MSIDPPEKDTSAAQTADLGASALSQDDSVWASPSVGSVEDVYRQLLARAPESAMEPRMEAVEQAVERPHAVEERGEVQASALAGSAAGLVTDHRAPVLDDAPRGRGPQRGGVPDERRLRLRELRDVGGVGEGPRVLGRDAALR